VPPVNIYGKSMVQIDNVNYKFRWIDGITQDLSGRLWYTKFNETSDDFDR